MKKCTKCHLTKPTSEFYKANHHSDGLASSCKTCQAEYMKEYRERNKEKENRKRKEWRKNNPERSKEHSRNQYHRDPQKAIESVMRWRRENKEYCGFYLRAWKANKRAEEWGLEGRITTSDIEALFESQSNCQVCGKGFGESEEDRFNLDHILAMGLGGENDSSNLQLLCESCHDSKNGQDRNKIKARRNAAL